MSRALLLSIAMFIPGILLTSNTKPMKPIKSQLQEMLACEQTPSVQYMFFDTDSVIFTFRGGMRDVKTNDPVSDSTRYHIFSITKTFTSLAVMQLAEAGILDLSKPVKSYLRDFPYPVEITVDQLLNHTAGLPNPLPLRWIHLPSEHEAFQRDAYFAEVFRKYPKLDHPPGTKFKYSNLGYVFLGQLVERVSGISFEEYVKQNVVNRSGIEPNDLDFVLDSSRHAVGYQKYLSFSNAVFGFLIDKPKFMSKRVGAWKPFKPFYNNGIAYGGLFATGPALMKYAQALLKPNSILLGDSQKRVLFAEATLGSDPTGMAHGWFTGNLNGHRYLAHAGGGGGYYVELRLYPDLGVGSVILFNRTGVSDERVLSKLDLSFIPKGLTNEPGLAN